MLKKNKKKNSNQMLLNNWTLKSQRGIIELKIPVILESQKLPVIWIEKLYKSPEALRIKKKSTKAFTIRKSKRTMMAKIYPLYKELSLEDFLRLVSWDEWMKMI